MTFRAINGVVVFNTTEITLADADALRAVYLEEYRAAVLAHAPIAATAALALHGEVAMAMMDAFAHTRTNGVRSALRR